MARVFSAVDIEDQKLLRELSRVRDQLDLGFNTVPGEKMHVTLEFFEDVNREEIERVKEAMESCSIGSFKANIVGVGAFPSRDYIRVVWAGIENGRFHELYNQVSEHSVDSSNDHDFMPHVTLMRVKDISPDRKKKLQKSMEEFRDHRFGELEVSSVKMFESELTGNGSRYRLLEEVKL